MKQFNSRLALVLPPHIIAMACISCLTIANAARADVADHLKQRWFVTEVVVFERLSINDDNTLEALASEEPGRQPRNLGAFAQGATSPTQYTAQTQRMLGSGSLRVPAQATPALDFSVPPKPGVAALSPNAGQGVQSNNEPEAAFAQAVQDKMRNAVAAYEADLGNRSFIFAANANPRLANEVQRIKRSRNYRVLWSGHWLQPVPTRDNPTQLLLQSGDLGNGLFTLEGSLGLTVSRYLHLQAKLWYHDPAYSNATGQPPIDATNPADQRPMDSISIEPQAPPKFMLLDAKRRMRSGILHYLDHPKLGLLVRIDPVAHPDDLVALVAAGERAQQ